MAGTGEGLGLAQALVRHGLNPTVSVVTADGARPFQQNGIPVRVGALERPALVGVLRACGARVLVDATHPYATGAHETARQAAMAAGIGLIRLQRPGIDGEAYPVHWVDGHEQAARLARSRGGVVFLATGGQTLLRYGLAFAVAPPVSFVVRLLPTRDNLLRCEQLGLPPDRIYAMKGPFPPSLNLALYQHAHARVLVTKDGHAQDGPDKIAPALALGMEVIVVRRPAGAGLATVSDVVAACLKAAETW